MPRNSGQHRGQKTRYLCGICKPLQRLATTDRTLVMSRSAVRVRSSALYFSCKSRKNRKAPDKIFGGLAAVGQQQPLTQSLVHAVGVIPASWGMSNIEEGVEGMVEEDGLERRTQMGVAGRALMNGIDVEEVVEALDGFYCYNLVVMH